MSAKVLERELLAGVREAFAGRTDQLADLPTSEARQIGFEAASAALSSLRWRQALGNRVSTAELSELLNVSRQALSKRVQSGSLLALPGTTTSWYPTWQIDRTHREVRRCARDIIHAFRSTLGHDVDPVTIATWMNTGRPDLDGRSPAAWIEADANPTTIVSLAEEFAARLAR
jgi:hypothetical protein